MTGSGLQTPQTLEQWDSNEQGFHGSSPRASSLRDEVTWCTRWACLHKIPDAAFSFPCMAIISFLTKKKTRKTSFRVRKRASWRRKRQPTLVFLSEESYEQRSLAGCIPWGRRESDMTEGLSPHAHSHMCRRTLVNKCYPNHLKPDC